MTRAARGADEAEAAARVKEDLTPVTYNYSFFHLVFALASMYLAMLMTGARAPPRACRPWPMRAQGVCSSPLTKLASIVLGQQ